MDNEFGEFNNLPKPEVQLNPMGCGLACVAFCAGISYKEVLAVVPEVLNLPLDSADTRGFYCPDLVELLRFFGYSYSWKRIKKRKEKNNLSNFTIVYIEKSSSYPYGHFLVFLNGYWMDPWINLPTDNRIDNALAGYKTSLPSIPTYCVYPLGEDKNS